MRMTEAEIERKAERVMDHLDRLLLAGDMSQKNYDAAVRDLEVWVQLRLLED
jgi:hypothetical protein